MINPLYGFSGITLDLTDYFNNDGIIHQENIIDGDFDGLGNAYPSNFFPPSDSEIIFDKIPFHIPDYNDGKMNNISLSGQTISIQSNKYQAIYLLGSAVHGSYEDLLTVHYTNGKIEIIKIGFTDWTVQSIFGEKEVIRFPYRINPTIRDSKDSTECWIFFQGYLLNENWELESIEFPQNKNIHIFAITLGENTNLIPPFRWIEQIPDSRVNEFFKDYYLTYEIQNLSTSEYKNKIARELQECFKIIDRNAYKEGNELKFMESVIRADQYLKSKIWTLKSNLSPMTIQMTGQSHIDMAWLWRLQETITKCSSTFTNMIQLMKHNPEFTYTQSQVQAYEWMELNYPELFKDIQEIAKKGQWEIIGGSWVEHDANMPSGESLVRQMYYGQNYFKEKFGKTTNIGWLPDTFGFCWTLPQILKKSGIDYFFTTKLRWNDTTRFPHNIFHWQSPDGSNILTYLSPRNLGEGINPLGLTRQAQIFERSTGIKDVMMIYGPGDGGGGPNQEMIESIEKYGQIKSLPKIIQGTAETYFNRITPKLKKIPIWNDELYLEYHRGTFTSQAQMKYWNRRLEYLLYNIEFYATLASSYGLTYPHEEIDRLWKKFLFNQFHDILPGTSISEVHQDALQDYQEIYSIGNRILYDAFDTLIQEIDTSHGNGESIVIFNPHSWERSSLVEISIDSSRVIGKSIMDKENDNQMITYQYTNESTILFYAENIPSCGYKTYDFISNENRIYQESGITVNVNILENRFFRLDIDTTTGCIRQIYDKRYNRNLLDNSGYGNLLQLFHDKPESYSAWNIDKNYEYLRWSLDSLDTIEIMDNNPLFAGLRIIKSYNQSKFIQDIVIYKDIPRIDFPMEVDWREKNTLLKVAFPLNISADSAYFEIPFGVIGRSLKPKTEAEKAKFEVPALQWADISDKEYGISLLNDSKYGYDAKGNILRLSLLRSPDYPDPNADKGHHQFTNSLYPHKGDWKTGNTQQQAVDLNHPLMGKITNSHKGSLPSKHSFLEFSPGPMTLSALKKSKSNDSWIIRYYEPLGKNRDTSIKLTNTLSKVWETDLLENQIKSLPHEKNTIHIHTGHNEIKTIELQLNELMEGD